MNNEQETPIFDLRSEFFLHSSDIVYCFSEIIFAFVPFTFAFLMKYGNQLPRALARG